MAEQVPWVELLTDLDRTCCDRTGRRAAVASIAKRAEGRYRDDSSKEHTRHFARKIDAQQWLIRSRRSANRYLRRPEGGGRISVGEWATAWLSRQADLNDWKPSTIAGSESMLKVRILPLWASVPLSRITYESAEHWVAGMVTSGLSASSTRRPTTFWARCPMVQ